MEPFCKTNIGQFTLFGSIVGKTFAIWWEIQVRGFFDKIRRVGQVMQLETIFLNETGRLLCYNLQLLDKTNTLRGLLVVFFIIHSKYLQVKTRIPSSTYVKFPFL